MLIIGICLMTLSQKPIVGGYVSVFLVAGIIVASIGFLWAFFSLMGTMSESSEQLKKFKEVTRLQKKLLIEIDFKRKVEEEFKEVLTETFPNFEKDLVSKFSFVNDAAKEAFLAVCPKLESGSSFEKYVNMISDAMTSIQKVEIAIDEKLAEISVYNEDPWLWFKRPMPANIKALIDKFDGA